MSTSDDISANDIPDILAGTSGTEAEAYANDPNAVLAALQGDPNLLDEIMQPGFVEVVNELAGDAAPTLGTPETVAQAYQDGNNESMSDAFNDLLAPDPASSDLNPQPLPPGPSPDTEQLIESQLAQIESELNPSSASAETNFQEFSNLGATPFESAQGAPSETAQASPFESAEASPFESAQLSPFEEQAAPFETAQAEPMSYEEPAGGFSQPEYET